MLCVLFLLHRLCNHHEYLKEWWDVSREGQLRTWAGGIPTPFKLNKVSPLRSIPGCDTPECIRPDLMHNFNMGVGGDLSASGLMAACRISIFGEDRRFQSRLDRAHDSFHEWCSQNRKTASIKSFELKKFKAKTTLADQLTYVFD